MNIIALLIVISLWLISGFSLEKIYIKAGFMDIPKFLFWLPALNVLFMIHLAFSKWPILNENP